MALGLDWQAKRDAVTEQVGRCLAQDQAAWKELVADHHRSVYYLCYTFTKSHSDAEDLTQEVFLKVYCNLSGYAVDKGTFRNWIQNVTRNHLVDYLRSARARVARSTTSLDAELRDDSREVTLADFITDPRLTPEQHLSNLEIKMLVRRGLDQLPAVGRDAVILCDLEGRDYEEAARILGIPVGTLKSRLNRGRANLARVLAPMSAVSIAAPREGKCEERSRRTAQEAKPKPTAGYANTPQRAPRFSLGPRLQLSQA